MSNLTLIEALESALARQKAVLSVNIFDYQSFRALATTFVNLHAPVIAQCSARLFRQYRPSEIVGWKNSLNLEDVWLHLDHCTDLSLIEACARAGFDSVMYDGSAQSLTSNIQASQQAVRRVREANCKCLIECEIGHVRGIEDGVGSDAHQDSGLIVPEVLTFFESVAPDLLAVGFGNMHGHYKGDEVFDLDLVEGVGKALATTPLVLHGGSGMNMTLVERLVQNGHCKINISTDLKVRWMNLLADGGVLSRGVKSPLEFTEIVQKELVHFFDQLHQKYASCLL